MPKSAKPGTMKGVSWNSHPGGPLYRQARDDFEKKEDGGYGGWGICLWEGRGEPIQSITPHCSIEELGLNNRHAS